MFPVTIFIDADACPVKDETYKVAQRYGLKTWVVSNAFMQIPQSLLVARMIVDAGPDVADDWIAERAQRGDIVITADIPLAAAVIDKGGLALNPRGELYSKENIRQTLDMRNFMDVLRSSGVETGGPPAFSQADRQSFANQLDRLLTSRRTS